ncbi:MAG: hypothetical protein K0S00_392 [Xanthobacteraceae bacterium]|jgi:hypothetical protein|nr:hypothetical protein [Xanthobacteraceae bacterium]
MAFVVIPAPRVLPSASPLSVIPAEGEAVEPGSLSNRVAIPDRPSAVRDDD